MEPQRMDKADFITSLFLSFLGLAVLVLSLRMPTFRNLGANPYSIPGIVPTILGVILLLLGIILLVRSVSRKGYHIKISLKGIILLLKRKSIRRLMIALFLSTTYVQLLGKMNYFLLNSFYILLFILVYELDLKEKILKQKKTIIIAFSEAFLIAGTIALVFQYLFLVRLP
jgi:hypothetical protein